MPVYKTYSSPMPTTAAQAAATTGTTIKTMLQIATPANRQLTVISWGFGFRSTPGGSSVVELLDTDVAATVTAHVAAGVQPLDPNAPASLMTLGTSATGFTASAEGAITASRVHGVVELGAIGSDLGADAVNWAYQFMPDERPIVGVSRFLRLRVTFNTAVNFVGWIVFSE